MEKTNEHENKINGSSTIQEWRNECKENPEFKNIVSDIISIIHDGALQNKKINMDYHIHSLNKINLFLSSVSNPMENKNDTVPYELINEFLNELEDYTPDTADILHEHFQKLQKNITLFPFYTKN